MLLISSSVSLTLTDSMRSLRWSIEVDPMMGAVTPGWLSEGRERRSQETRRDPTGRIARGKRDERHGPGNSNLSHGYPSLLGDGLDTEWEERTQRETEERDEEGSARTGS